MAEVQVDEAELALLKQAHILLDGLYSHPKEGMRFKKLLKEVNPNLRIPEIDAAAPHVEKLTGLEKQLSDFMTEIRNEREDRAFEAKMLQVKDQFQLTDEGMDKLKKVMVDRKVADPEVAAGYLAHSTPPEPSRPTGLGSTKWDFLTADKGSEDDMKALIDDPDAWLDRQIPKILAEERGTAIRVPRG